MNPREDYLTKMTSNKSDVFIIELYKIYHSTNASDSSLSSYAFEPVTLQKSESFMGNLPIVSDNFPNYTQSQLISVTLNSLVASGFMYKTSGRYYLQESAYKRGMKKTNILRYWNKYHPNVLYPSLCTVIIGVLTIFLTSA